MTARLTGAVVDDINARGEGDLTARPSSTGHEASMLAIVACVRSGTSGSLDSGHWAHYLGTKSDPPKGDHHGQADLLSDHVARRVYRGRRWQLRLGGA